MIRTRSGASWLVILAAVSGCASEATAPVPAPPLPVASGLKEIVLSSLPAPYYHFEHDSNGRVTFVSFASEFTRYDVIYAGDRISEMRNNILVNHDRLVYEYDDGGRVTAIREMDDEGTEFELLLFTYDGPKLTGLQRQRRLNGEFVLDKEMTFTYSPDGNLLELAQHRPAVPGFQDQQRYADRFEDYDGGVNVDGFSLLHDDFFDHLVLLPLELQKGNPRRVTRSGDGTNLVAEYTYSYDDQSRPLRRAGVATLTNGSEAGRKFNISATYSYY